jgi:hypothetical protein
VGEYCGVGIGEAEDSLTGQGNGGRRKDRKKFMIYDAGFKVEGLKVYLCPYHNYFVIS